MGYYIECDGPRNKAKWLIDHHEAIVIDEDTARDWVNDRDVGIVCVVDNVLFEAAGFAFDGRELEVFAQPDDRGKAWLALDRAVVEELSGYAKYRG
jgi:hypothetical protein